MEEQHDRMYRDARNLHRVRKCGMLNDHEIEHRKGVKVWIDLGILRAGPGSGRAKKSPVFFLAARA